jgi:hypothetical protein
MHLLRLVHLLTAAPGHWFRKSRIVLNTFPLFGGHVRQSVPQQQFNVPINLGRGVSQGGRRSLGLLI